MKKVLILTACMLVATGLAFGGVSGTSHDLTSASLSDELCIYCHTPHNSRLDVPLWNHDAATSTYTAYDSPTMDGTGSGTDWTTDTDDTKVSSMCLSCHDGTVAVSAFNGNTGGATDKMTGTSMVGTDLSNDHPVGFTYSEVGNKDTATVVALTTGIQLFGAGENQVECASCHDVHTSAVSNFLHFENTASAICVSCHNN